MSTATREQFVALLHDLTRQVQALDADDFDKILSGELKLEIRVSREPRSGRRRKKKELSTDDLEHLRNELRGAGTREQARRLIDGTLHTKGDLFQMAKVLDIPVQKRDSVEHLKARLEEATVGFRIRSAAIQGKTEELFAKAVEPIE